MAHPQSLGSDFDALDDITPGWTLAPDERTAFAQAVYRRLNTTKGLFAYAPSYGGNVFLYLLESGLTIAQIGIEIQTELLRDERVRSVTVQERATDILILFTSHQAPDYTHTLSVDKLTGAVVLGG